MKREWVEVNGERWYVYHMPDGREVYRLADYNRWWEWPGKWIANHVEHYQGMAALIEWSERAYAAARERLVAAGRRVEEKKQKQEAKRKGKWRRVTGGR